jgi:hypothetical protein
MASGRNRYASENAAFANHMNLKFPNFRYFTDAINPEVIIRENQISEEILIVLVPTRVTGIRNNIGRKLNLQRTFKAFKSQIVKIGRSEKINTYSKSFTT